MDHKRYCEIESGITDAKLTSEEIAEGWHFCREWDGLLIGPGMPEMEACLCKYSNKNCPSCGDD
jgi:hypothetical protein